MNVEVKFECQHLRNGTLHRAFTARAKPRPLGGVYIGGQCFEPCGADIFSGMSKRHTKAIARANGLWWTASGLIDVLRMDLHGANGAPLGSIVARAEPLSFDCTLLGFDGCKPARATQGEGRRFEVRASDQSISIAVPAQLALQRFWLHPAHGTPEFYYS